MGFGAGEELGGERRRRDAQRCLESELAERLPERVAELSQPAEQHQAGFDIEQNRIADDRDAGRELQCRERNFLQRSVLLRDIARQQHDVVDEGARGSGGASGRSTGIACRGIGRLDQRPVAMGFSDRDRNARQQSARHGLQRKIGKMKGDPEHDG